MMSFIGFKYHPKIDVTVKKLAADITFTQRPETMFARIQRLRLKEEPNLSLIPACSRIAR
jgi:hypothetical protein